MTRSDLQTLLANLRLSPRRREGLKADLALLEGISRGDDLEREITLGPKSQAALDRVVAAERDAIGGPSRKLA